MANGTGKIVKGKTDEDKQKFMYYAFMLDELDLSLFIYFDFLNLLNVGSYYDKSSTSSMVLSKLSKQEVITEILSSHVPCIVSELEYRKIEDIKQEWIHIGFGIANTLRLMGYTENGYSNTPTNIENLSWSKDLVIAKAYHEHLLKNEVILPDIKFVKDNRYKM